MMSLLIKEFSVCFFSCSTIGVPNNALDIFFLEGLLQLGK